VPVIKGTNVQGKFMPNVKGMGLKDALYLLENTGIKVVVKGRERSLINLFRRAHL
jgi:cell division protein FtsI (penicillin-binding protein 3)